MSLELLVGHLQVGDVLLGSPEVIEGLVVGLLGLLQAGHLGL